MFLTISQGVSWEFLVLELGMNPVCSTISVKISTLTLESFSFLQLDLAIDGADEVDKMLNCIKGGGYVICTISFQYTLD